MTANLDALQLRSSIPSLPTELLLDIFYYLVSPTPGIKCDEYGSYYHGLVSGHHCSFSVTGSPAYQLYILRLVCSAWSALVSSRCTLWSTVDLRFPQTFRTSVNYSGQVPLHIYGDFSDISCSIKSSPNSHFYFPPLFLSKLVESIAGSADRIASVDLHANHYAIVAFVQSFSTAFADHSLPLLKIWTTQAIDSTAYSQPDDSSTVKFTSLHTLTLKDVTLPLYSDAFRGLRTFKIHLSNPRSFHLDFIVGVFSQACRTIQEVTISLEKSSLNNAPFFHLPTDQSTEADPERFRTIFQSEYKYPRLKRVNLILSDPAVAIALSDSSLHLLSSVLSITFSSLPTAADYLNFISISPTIAKMVDSTEYTLEERYCGSSRYTVLLPETTADSPTFVSNARVLFKVVPPESIAHTVMKDNDIQSWIPILAPYGFVRITRLSIQANYLSNLSLFSSEGVDDYAPVGSNLVNGSYMLNTWKELFASLSSLESLTVRMVTGCETLIESLPALQALMPPRGSERILVLCPKLTTVRLVFYNASSAWISKRDTYSQPFTVRWITKFVKSRRALCPLQHVILDISEGRDQGAIYCCGLDFFGESTGVFQEELLNLADIGVDVVGSCGKYENCGFGWYIRT